MDFFAILPPIISVCLKSLEDMKILGKVGKMLRLIRVMRIMRLFKLIRHFVGLQSLLFTIKQVSYTHCWLEHVWNSKKMLAQAKHIFDTFEYFWVDHESFFCNCLATRWHHHHFSPGGTIITFAENWNFELKFYWVNSFREKITSRVFWITFLCKNGTKMPKNIHSFSS